MNNDEYRVFKKYENDEVPCGSKKREPLISDEDLKIIQKYTRSKIEKNDLYTFPVKLCDNDIDRDLERFSDEALYDLSELFSGATGIYDHDWKSSGQIARIYKCEVICEKNKKSNTGDEYKYLCGYAYMIRNEKNKDIISEIDAGIKREVSISCKADTHTCCICGKNEGTCSHVKGKKYKIGGDMVECHIVLGGISDAYEWSFVAVPAQKKAGVIKKYDNKSESQNSKLLKQLDKYKEKIKIYEDMVSGRRRILAEKLCAVCGMRNKDMASDMLLALKDEELLDFEKGINIQYGKLYPGVSQFEEKKEKKENFLQNNNFKI